MAPSSPALSASATDHEDDDFQDAESAAADSPVVSPTNRHSSSSTTSASSSSRNEVAQPSPTTSPNQEQNRKGKGKEKSSTRLESGVSDSVGKNGNNHGKRATAAAGNKKSSLQTDTAKANRTAKDNAATLGEGTSSGPSSPLTPTQQTAAAAASAPRANDDDEGNKGMSAKEGLDSWLNDSSGLVESSPALSPRSGTEDESEESEEGGEESQRDREAPSPLAGHAESKASESTATIQPHQLSKSKDRHFSLFSAPETPNSSSPRTTAFETAGETESDGEEEEEGARTKRSSLAWRASLTATNGSTTRGGTFADVSLADDRSEYTTESENAFAGSEADDDEGDLIKLDASAHRRAIAAAVGASSGDEAGTRNMPVRSGSATSSSTKNGSLDPNALTFQEDFKRLQQESNEDENIDWGMSSDAAHDRVCAVWLTLDIDIDFWGRVMADYEEVASTQPRELSRAIQQGIPPALRGMTWQLMAASKDEQLCEIYHALLTQSSPHEKAIIRDLNRTFPKHEYFAEATGAGQENLFNVVKAYSLYDEEVGYTQGLQFIMPDEEAFCVLVRLMKSYDLRSHYTPNMPGLQLRLFQFDRLLEELVPGVFLHLLRQGVKSSMYASQWFLTLFGYRFPLELVSSVFDLVFAEGVEAVFRFSIAILKRNETAILSLEFEDCIEFLKNSLFEAYAPNRERDGPTALYRAADFAREALSVKITPLMLDQFGEEWDTLLRQQTAHAAEVDALRKANHQLSQQVRQLEASLSQINTEHCDLVKQVVMAKLEREELEDELVKYKIAYADLSHQTASDGASSSAVSRASIAQNQSLPIATSAGMTVPIGLDLPRSARAHSPRVG
ncbi:BZ3500_MvSof-1268-A1-R1_Chr1-1g01129 [Microbotryum saponariae]|uniref:BZ3500_MvSof-1268-A1-R1_Chr1-1g01129 protein n=1 Tax=Microbotryum saponariae TaxID=289078 RepID=A0A2X0KAR7_9BASI|nr:BZ3500_MvSof-1268-A1-R1_Chr1-1g01129 [Microbotryum saponariae]SCZ93450.1 BZ3501_MvSof-1269-A2-R1_Chr1-1g00726 [Microbotryum saponariae]